jgi:hypothetical protein
MKIARSLLTNVFVLLLAAVAATAAIAQGPQGPGGPGGPGGGGAPLAMLLLDTQVYNTLGLTAAQQALWTALQTADRNARAQHETARSTLQTLVANQFASGAPDLVAIEKAMMAERQAMSDAGGALSAQAITLYSGLNTGQQAIVVTAAQARYQQAHQR